MLTKAGSESFVHRVHLNIDVHVEEPNLTLSILKESRSLSESSFVMRKTRCRQMQDRRLEKAGGVAYDTRPPQARQDALLPAGIR
jgi:hypothetical protein